MLLSNYRGIVFYCTLGAIRTAGNDYAEAIEKALNQLFMARRKAQN